MEKFLAHISGDREQTILDHLEGTARLCQGFAEKFEAGEQGRQIGLAHDIGKCSQGFQDRLRGGKRVDHATAGALECAKMDELWASACVAGHHSGLPNVGSMQDQAGDPTLFGRLRKGLQGGIPNYTSPLTLSPVAPPKGYGESYLADSFLIRMLYSCLVDADYLDTESFISGSICRENRDDIPALWKKLETYIAPWGNPKNELNRLRCGILDECMGMGNAVDCPRGVYTLTVPTGGGKTVASVAFALAHAKEKGLDRVIYVIPYTSIIEQTADVFRKIFGGENVVEHHSNAGFSVEENGDAGEYRRTRATENWDAPIIVTTAVQFFESLYANKPSKCRKLHNIANSVVVFDEAQTLPAQHLRPCVAAMALLVRLFRSTVLLCTATQPVLHDLFQTYAPDLPLRELCPDTAPLFAAFRRVTFRNVGETDADRLAADLSGQAQVLCVVNSRKAAQELFHRLPNEGKFHLSTLMYPVHRRQTLAEIRRRLQEGLPCRVVSTSLIEAGVDVDFPAVYRELAGLDSILQAAGRCNREGKNPAGKSVVTIFSGLSATPPLLRVNRKAAEMVMDSGADLDDPQTVRRYFEEYRALASQQMDKAGVVAAFEQGIEGCQLPFQTVAEKFHLIDTDTKTVYIPLDGGGPLTERLLAGEVSRGLLRQLGQYGVSVYEREYQKHLRAGSLLSVGEDMAVLTNLSLYDPMTGLAMDPPEGEGFFV